MVDLIVLYLGYLCIGNMDNDQKAHRELFLRKTSLFETIIYSIYYQLRLRHWNDLSE